MSDKSSAVFPEGWMASEKGNTMVSNDDGAIAVWIPVGGGLAWEVTNTPGNSPSFCMSLDRYDAKALRAHIIERCAGWFCQRWNVDDAPPIDAKGNIYAPED